MEFTQQDTKALYQIWMSQKAKMRVTQMEMAKQLNLSQRDFSAMIRGALPLSMTFVSQFCAQCMLIQNLSCLHCARRTVTRQRLCTSKPR